MDGAKRKSVAEVTCNGLAPPAANPADDPDNDADEQCHQDQARPDARFENIANDLTGGHRKGNENKEVEEGKSVDGHDDLVLGY